jgi:hypothetical protein
MGSWLLMLEPDASYLAKAPKFGSRVSLGATSSQEQANGVLFSLLPELRLESVF